MKNVLFIIAALILNFGCIPEDKQSQVVPQIILVVTNHAKLADTGKKTGYFLSEVAHPYDKFKKAGHDVVFASPNGGEAPMDPKSLDLDDQINKDFYENEQLMARLENTKKLSELDYSKYQAIFFAGGHGTMWDFPDSESVQNAVREIYEGGGVVAAVCHGPAALVNVKLSNGEFLISGKKVTGFTNEEEDIVELSRHMPFMLEDRLVERGAEFSKSVPWKQKVVVDQRLATGQNPASAGELGAQVVSILNQE
jgi:putative intracellular protease/amidase